MVRLKIYQKEYEEEFGYPAAQFEPEHTNITATHIGEYLCIYPKSRPYPFLTTA